MSGPSIYPVILSGGSGTRLWPLSRKANPKQFHKLATEHTMIQDTVLRFAGHDGFGAPLILGNADHADLIAEQLRAIDIEPQLLVLEPAPRNTAPAAAAAALALLDRDPDTIMLLAPADHVITKPDVFRDAVLDGVGLAKSGRIVTFGINPSRPETGYGYIKGGHTLAGAGRAIIKFEEKPELPDAERFVASGDYVWNAGIFLFRADAMIAEMEGYCPEILAKARSAVEHASISGDRLLLNAEHFGAAPSESLDYAVMEHTGRGAVIGVDAGWSDVGSWSSLFEIKSKDEAGNAADGAVLLGCSNVLTVSDGPQISAIGLENVVIVATQDGVLVSKLDADQQVKDVVAALQAQSRDDLV